MSPRLAVIVLFAASLTATPALAQSCKAEVGAEEAQSYVDHCIDGSPATRPPCNMENPCELIISEIIRGCDMLGEDAPDYCADYAE